jgi:hypothetical protein
LRHIQDPEQTNKPSISERARALHSRYSKDDDGNIVVTDSEAQTIIAAASDNFNLDFFYTNRSGMSLESVQNHFRSLFPSVGYQTNPQILCGYDDNRVKTSIKSGVYMRKINLRAIPWGRGSIGSGDAWHKTYLELPRMIAFDVDENKEGSTFRNLYPEYRCYEIHDALDIARPLVITINPISMNCQYIYQMHWTAEDYLHPKKALTEYNNIRRELSKYLGADPAFCNHVVRSPMFVAGHHRKNPSRSPAIRKDKDGQIKPLKTIKVGKESLWHHSIWYEPKAYSLAELREIIVYLRNEIGIVVHNEAAINNKTITADDSGAIQQTKNISHRCYVDHQELAKTPASQIREGQRNPWLFSTLSQNHCRKAEVAGKFRNNNDRDGFMAYAMDVAMNLYHQIPIIPGQAPFTTKDVEGIVKSVIDYCTGPTFRAVGMSSEEASFQSRLRWGYLHIPNTTKAKERCISERTFYRHGHHRLDCLAVYGNSKSLYRQGIHRLIVGAKHAACGSPSPFYTQLRSYRASIDNELCSFPLPHNLIITDSMLPSNTRKHQTQIIKEARGPP